MLAIRRSAERGHARYEWLDTHYTFSFSEYHDPRHMGFRSLRVINEDRIAGGGGFPRHGHRDMEILTYVIEGELKHQDSLGNGSTIRPGELQRMTAGSGILHSEANASETDPIHLLQIWIFPDRAGITPSYEQKEFDRTQARGRWQTLASRDARDGSLTIHQDASLSQTFLDPSEVVSYELGQERHAWLQVVSGSVKAVGVELKAGDGLAISDTELVEVEGLESSAVLLFDLA
ncbi:pirin family protein [Singulisphaera sp. PoT]|uniref:pirin family protein n=1 Tax=Singulisphaera sp. PoT TaxID=3411797 RepID=UPI003BF55AC7